MHDRRSGGKGVEQLLHRWVTADIALITRHIGTKSLKDLFLPGLLAGKTVARRQMCTVKRPTGVNLLPSPAAHDGSVYRGSNDG